LAVVPTAPVQIPMKKARKDFQRLAELRAKEAALLAKSGHQQGAYYLRGLAVECALKACIAKKTKRYDFPPDAKYASKVYTHELADLLKLAELNGQLDIDVITKPQLANNWGVVEGWSVNSRYDTSKLNGKNMVAAVNSPDGVLQWIKLYW
jgi:HEPN domain-containing protein